MVKIDNDFPTFRHNKTEVNQFFYKGPWRRFWHGGWRFPSGCGEKFGPKSKNHDREQKGRMVKNGNRRMGLSAM